MLIHDKTYGIVHREGLVEGMIALNVADPWRPIIQTTDYVCEFYGEIIWIGMVEAGNATRIVHRRSTDMEFITAATFSDICTDFTFF